MILRRLFTWIYFTSEALHSYHLNHHTINFPQVTLKYIAYFLLSFSITITVVYCTNKVFTLG